jgi:hypothetical protein
VGIPSSCDVFYATHILEDGCAFRKWRPPPSQLAPLVTMTQVNAQRLFRTIGTLQIAIIVLVVITALVHLQRGIGMSVGGFGGGPGGGPPGGAPGGAPSGAPGRPPGGAPGGFNMFQYLPLPLPILFLINGIGYLVLGSALYLPALARYRRVVRWLLIIFAAATFMLYFLFNGFRLSPIVIVDKVAELTLIVLLLIDDRQATRATADTGQT